MLLRLAPHGTMLRVRHIAGPPALARELFAFGVRPGSDVIVGQRAASGGLVLRVGADRIAVDHRACAAIEVDVIAQSSSGAA